jgi:hypothetical protein
MRHLIQFSDVVAGVLSCKPANCFSGIWRGKKSVFREWKGGRILPAFFTLFSLFFRTFVSLLKRNNKYQSNI